MSSSYFVDELHRMFGIDPSPVDDLLEKIAAPMGQSPGGPSRRSNFLGNMRRINPFPTRGNSGRNLVNTAPKPATAVSPPPPAPRAAPGVIPNTPLQGTGASGRLNPTAGLGLTRRNTFSNRGSGSGASSSGSTRQALDPNARRPSQGAFQTIQTNAKGQRLDSQTGMPLVNPTGQETGARFSQAPVKPKFRYANPDRIGSRAQDLVRVGASSTPAVSAQAPNRAPPVSYSMQITNARMGRDPMYNPNAPKPASQMVGSAGGRQLQLRRTSQSYPVPQSGDQFRKQR